MKLTELDRIDLFKLCARELLGRDKWPTTTPPARDGSTKTVSPHFAIACHAAAFVRAAETVLDDDEAPHAGSSGPKETPF